MTDQPNNPPAFTQNEWSKENGKANEGMTLLDHFASKALQGLLAADLYTDDWKGHSDISRHSYALAQSMLVERIKHVK